MEEKDRTQEMDKGLSPDQRQDRMGQGTTVYDGLVKKFHFIRQERVFFCGAFRSDDRNSLKECMRTTPVDKIMEKTHQVPDEETRFLLEMYCRGSVYMTVKWVLTGMKFTPEELAGFLVEAMPRKLEEEFVRLGLLEEPRAHREDGEAAAQSSGKIREW